MKQPIGSTLFLVATLVMALAHTAACAQGRWVKLAPFPEPAEEVLGASAGGKLYVIGGATMLPGSKDTAIHPARAHRSLTTVEEYDPATNSWRERSMMPTPRNHLAIGTVNGRIYVLGGRIGAAFISGGGNRLDLVEEYDVATDSWNSVRARIPTARSAVAYAVHGGRVYVAGGEHQDYNLSTAFRAVEGFDAAKKEWFVMPAMPLQRHGLAGAVVGNRFHLISGDVQSAGTGLEMHTDAHDAFEFESTAK